ncbi:hypothetical protein [Vibrio coralliilyticus]|uniref:hypothetical protein n=1 Tax=Vibrio coralliilyticus TaxID=190893 RepID=UPI00148D7E67|nr:hypothetical protein [Vibrio coralliilyticus]
MRQIIKDFGASIAGFAACAAIYQWGYTVGGDKSNNLVQLLETQKSELTSDLKNANAERESLKVELQAANTRLVSATNTVSSKATVVKEHQVEQNIASNDKEPTILYETQIISTGSSGTFYDSNVLVTVIATDFTGNPLRHKVFASIYVSGHDPLEIKSVDIGAVYDVGNYKIALTGAGTLSATFDVRRKT